MKNDRISIRDQQALEASLERQGRRLDHADQEDVVIDGNRRLKLRSPNGHYWIISVDNAGVLSATDAGTSL